MSRGAIHQLRCLLLAAAAAGLALHAQAPSETILVSLIDRPVGRELVSSKTVDGLTTYASELELTERGGPEAGEQHECDDADHRRRR